MSLDSVGGWTVPFKKRTRKLEEKLTFLYTSTTNKYLKSILNIITV